ncbi:hypothetical protein ES319_A01G160900v1 [Gossypium barbadense]|uniref:Uncharacterized protein n=2 Tax=Gossypium TaxID=3633 RepID=A0A5J5WZQ6_GOSBA|nr:hypothetical protein ES319_A01G160900v1 [Gossypium barbadense]TYH31449.1 hypothetical protein ES288_A01G174100v1 [Gossypium darwinii]
MKRISTPFDPCSNLHASEVLWRPYGSVGLRTWHCVW